MRGKALAEPLAVEGDRITPAYAGKSHALVLDLSLRGDHPRVCGEKLQTAQQEQLIAGSPPRMRGKD